MTINYLNLVFFILSQASFAFWLQFLVLVAFAFKQRKLNRVYLRCLLVDSLKTSHFIVHYTMFLTVWAAIFGFYRDLGLVPRLSVDLITMAFAPHILVELLLLFWPLLASDEEK